MPHEVSKAIMATKLNLPIEVLGSVQLQRKALTGEVAADGRTLPAVISTSAPVARAFGNEVLSHAADAIDLSRAVDGKLPLLQLHDQQRWPIGYASDLTLDGEQLRAQLHFAETDAAEEPLRLHRQGVPLGVSIGYSVDWETAEHDEDAGSVRFNRWTPLEVSVVPVQADAAAILGRQHEGKRMPGDDKTAADPGGEVVTFDTAFRSGETRGVEAGQKLERQRLVEIRSIFGLQSVPDNAMFTALRETAELDGWSADRTRAEVLQRLGQDGAPAASQAAGEPDQVSARTTVSAGDDSLDHFVRNATTVLMHRSSMERTEDSAKVVKESGLGGLKLLDMCREWLRLGNNPAYRLPDQNQMVDAVFLARAGGHTTSDFTNVLANVANKSLLRGWEEQPETWRQLARVGSLPDFKLSDRPGLSHFTDLAEIPEDGDPESGTITDFKEQIQLVEYARKFRLTRKTIINDDVGAFTRVPMLMGRAAARKVGDVLFDALVSNSSVGPTLNQDSTALFHADHSNIGASGGAPTTGRLDDGFTKMGTQTDPTGAAYLQITPSIFLVPKALEATARALMAAQYNPDDVGGMEPNVFQGRATVVSDARLDANSAARWYLFGDPNINDTWEVAFLNGSEAPYMRETMDPGNRGIEWVVGIDCGVAALDYRAAFTNAGA